jgi:D-3-phosphoglycerate dehydrogenase
MLGKDKEKLAEIIGQYDGLAIRSATKVTEKLLENAHQSEGDRPRRDRR